MRQKPWSAYTNSNATKALVRDVEGWAVQLDQRPRWTGAGWFGSTDIQRRRVRRVARGTTSTHLPLMRRTPVRFQVNVTAMLQMAEKVAQGF